MRVLEQSFVAPHVDSDSRSWWDALAEGRLELPRCASCERAFFPPQPGCPNCGSMQWDLVPSPGLGRLYSWVVVELAFDPTFADDVPYTIVAVELDEGVRLIGRYLGQWDGVEPGTRMQGVIYRAREQPLLGFESAPSPSGSGSAPSR